MVSRATNDEVTETEFGELTFTAGTDDRDDFSQLTLNKKLTDIASQNDG
jgi:hypothetical protein